MEGNNDNEYYFASEDGFDENTIVFQIDDEDGNPKEVIRVDDDGFHIYGERLKTADDVAAAFRHFFARSAYYMDELGRVVVEDVRGTEEKEGE